MFMHFASAQVPQTPPPQPQRPVFRADAHFVRVDAYPRKDDGTIVEGLTAENFEIQEDGKPQKVETFEFIRFETNTPEANRRDPNSQREGFDLAADPRIRVFVLYLDVHHISLAGGYRIRQPLIDFLNRMIGPNDLFGVMTPRQTLMDLMLGRKTQTIEEQLTKYWTFGAQNERADFIDADLDRPDAIIATCYPDGAGSPYAGVARQVIARRRLDQTFRGLEALVQRLGSVREERKDIVLFSSGWPLFAVDRTIEERIRRARGGGGMPTAGVDQRGRITLGPTQAGAGEVNTHACDEVMNRVTNIDFDRRFRELLLQARQANVWVHPVNPSGLEAAFSVNGWDDITYRTDQLRTLAENTDGVPVLNTNDLRSGLKRLTDSLSSYYILGYYTSNTKWDGNARRITVRLKPSGERITARREYRAPTEAEMTMRNAPPPAVKPEVAAVDVALGVLGRLRPSADAYVYGRARAGELDVVIELPGEGPTAAAWKAGAQVDVTVTNRAGQPAGIGAATLAAGVRSAIVRFPVSDMTAGPWQATVRIKSEAMSTQDRIDIRSTTGVLLGDPLISRAMPAPVSPAKPVASFLFFRTERVRVEWPVLKPIDRREARLLDRAGKPLPLPAVITERPGDTPAVVVDINLGPLTFGDYVVELVAGSGAETERKLVAIRVVR